MYALNNLWTLISLYDMYQDYLIPQVTKSKSLKEVDY